MKPKSEVLYAGALAHALRLVSPLLVLLIGLALLPAVAGGFYQGVVSKMMIFGLFATSLNLILGYAGLASLGHAVYFGLGGYAVAKLSLAGVSGLWAQFLFAVLLALLLAAMFGFMTLRAKGAYLLMITLALAQVVWGIAYSWRNFTGADDGLPGVPRPTSGWLWSLETDLGLYYFVWVVFAAVVSTFSVLVASPFGYVLVGIRENERRMIVLGYNVWLYKYIACMLSGLLAGVAGALLTWQNGFVGPTYLSLAYSATALIMVILGGAGTVLGPVVGAFIIIGLESLVSSMTERWVLILGSIYVLVALFAPEGLTSVWARLRGEQR